MRKFKDGQRVRVTAKTALNNIEPGMVGKVVGYVKATMYPYEVLLTTSVKVANGFSGDTYRFAEYELEAAPAKPKQPRVKHKNGMVYARLTPEQSMALYVALSKSPQLLDVPGMNDLDFYSESVPDDSEYRKRVALSRATYKLLDTA
jgi:hypothetical protein